MPNWKSIVRRSVAGALGAAGWPALRRKAPQRALTILCYHRVLPAGPRTQYPFSDLAVTPASFEAQVAHCAEHYTCLPLSEAAERLFDGAAVSAPKPMLSITFDDGYWDNATFAQPALDKHGVRATFFIISDLVGTTASPWYDRMARALAHVRGRSAAINRSDSPADAWLAEQMSTHGRTSITSVIRAVKKLPARDRVAIVERAAEIAGQCGWQPDASDRIMDESELRALAAAGHEIGSHTRSHPILPLLGAEALSAELAGSRKTLQDIVPQEVTALAYPNGDCDPAVVVAAKAAGYRWAVTTVSDGNGRDADRMRLARYVVLEQRIRGLDGGFSGLLFDLEMTGLADSLFRRHA